MERKMYKTKLETQIKSIESKHSDVFQASKEIIPLCRLHLSELRNKVVNQGFLNENDEIHFFKFTKQIPMVNLIYYIEVQDFETSFPMNNFKAQKNFIKIKTKELNDFFHMHYSFAKYMRLKQTHFDKQFFTRKYTDVHYARNTSFYIFDSFFYTSHDYLLAKLKAFQSVSTYLQNRLKGLEEASESSDLHWTYTKVSLTELVYALYLSGAINDGKANIKQIAKAFEQIFNFALGDVYRTYVEICSRKKDRVKFLDELSCALSKNIEQGDA